MGASGGFGGRFMQPGEKFSTLKTRRNLHKELDEHAGQGGEMREQFAAYRRLRTQHQKQLKQVHTLTSSSLSYMVWIFI